MADDGYTYARPDAEEIDEPDPTFDVLTDYTVDLDNPIGVGGFGSVHFGCQRSTRKMVAVKAVSKARTQQAAERGAAHTSAEEILKMEIEVMRDLSETRHRNLCAAAHPPPALSRPPTAAAFVPLPAHRRHPTASRRYPAAAATVHARRLTPSTPHAPSQAPPHAHPTPTPRPRACAARSSTAAGRTTCTCTSFCSCARAASCRTGCSGGPSRSLTPSRSPPRSRTTCCRCSRAHARPCVRVRARVHGLPLAAFAASTEPPPLLLPRTLGAARVARQALRKCHELGIVHRDVKPPNLIYSAPPSDEGSLLKLVDYGLAARHSPGDEPLIEARRTRDAPRTPRAH